MTSPQPRQNRLAREKSPYLLQHASNPVDWWPWGPGAFREAERLERPIFLSIGYSSCHWCHVMEHESFADAEVAKVLNDHFVCIKVDREERPDIDEVYMTAVTAMGIGGGWPLSVWLTPDGKPFTGGTYFPKEDRWGRPGFLRVLNAIAERWTDLSRREELKNHGRQVADFVRQSYEVVGRDSLGPEALTIARQSLGAYYDPEYGGFGQQPKFPSPTTLEMVLRHAVGHKDALALEMAENTLEKMARGGIHDHIGGGFHRYSVTRDWLIPHFEKMLYDNAQLLGTYAWAHLATGKEIYAETARDIARWVRREMTHPSGGFFSAQDADDPGGPEGEGGFYVWTPAEIAAVLPEEQAKAATLWFGVADPGNWHEKPGRSILQRPLTLEEAASRLGVSARRLADLLEEAREGLYRAREKRPKPMTDTKILADWNGLMISGLCRAWQALGDEEFLAAALAAGKFIRREMMRDGRIVRRWRDGDAMHEGVLDDYAFVVAAFLDLYESCFDAEWLREAFRLHALAIDLFHDADRGGYFHTPRDGEPLIARSKSGYDQARPSGNGVMAMNDLRIGEMTGDEAPRRRAQAALDAFGARAAQSAIGFSALMNALDFAHAATREIFVAGEWSDPRTQALVRAVWRNPDTNRVIALATPEIGKILPPAAGKTPVNGSPAAYVCRGYVCETPVTDPAQLK